MRLKKKDVLQFITGQRVTAKVIEQEQLKRLSQLIDAESREEYSSLCELWATSPKTEDLKALSYERIVELVNLRQKLDLVSTHKRQP